MRNKPTIPRVCVRCGGAFLARSHQVKIGKALFCSIPCSNASRPVRSPLTMSEDGAVALVPLCTQDGTIKGHALIDAADATAVSRWPWHLDGHGYAARTDRSGGRPRRIRLHRILLGLTVNDGLLADHINRDRLDNRRANLRIVTKGQNGQNTPSKQGSTSSYRGVSWKAESGKWLAQLMVDRKKIYIGLYAEETEAAAAVKAARLRLMPFAVD